MCCYVGGSCGARQSLIAIPLLAEHIFAHVPAVPIRNTAKVACAVLNGDPFAVPRLVIRTSMHLRKTTRGTATLRQRVGSVPPGYDRPSEDVLFVFGSIAHGTAY